jgi:hypothetical protein
MFPEFFSNANPKIFGQQNPIISYRFPDSRQVLEVAEVVELEGETDGSHYFGNQLNLVIAWKKDRELHQYLVTL